MLKRRLFKLFDEALTEIPRFVRFWCSSASVFSCIEIEVNLMLSSVGFPCEKLAYLLFQLEFGVKKS